MITAIINKKVVAVPVDEFLKQLEIMDKAVHHSIFPTYWCDGKELNIQCILDSLKFK